MPIGNHLCRQLSTTWIHNVSELYAHGQKVFFRRGISLHYIYRLFLLSVPQRFGWFCTLFCTLDCKVTFLATLLATVSLSRTLQITSPVFTSIEIRKYYRSRFTSLWWVFSSENLPVCLRSATNLRSSCLPIACGWTEVASLERQISMHLLSVSFDSCNSRLRVPFSFVPTTILSRIRPSTNEP